MNESACVVPNCRVCAEQAEMYAERVAKAVKLLEGEGAVVTWPERQAPFRAPGLGS